MPALRAAPSTSSESSSRHPNLSARSCANSAPCEPYSRSTVITFTGVCIAKPPLEAAPWLPYARARSRIGDEGSGTALVRSIHRFAQKIKGRGGNALPAPAHTTVEIPAAACLLRHRLLRHRALALQMLAVCRSRLACRCRGRCTCRRPLLDVQITVIGGQINVRRSRADLPGYRLVFVAVHAQAEVRHY